MNKCILPILLILTHLCGLQAALITYISFNGQSVIPDIDLTGGAVYTTNVSDAPLVNNALTDVNGESGFIGGDNTFGQRFSRLDSVTTDGYFQLALDLSGFTDVEMSFAAAAFTGADAPHSALTFQYSTDGGNLFSSPSQIFGSLPEVSSGGAFELVQTGPVAAVAQQSNVVLRVQLGNFNASGADEAVLMDNLKVTGTALIPEPSTLFLLSMSGVLILGLRRRHFR